MKLGELGFPKATKTLFLFLGSLFFIIYISYVFFRCMRKEEKLSESLTKKEKEYFYLAITYIFTYIIL